MCVRYCEKQGNRRRKVVSAATCFFVEPQLKLDGGYEEGQSACGALASQG